LINLPQSQRDGRLSKVGDWLHNQDGLPIYRRSPMQVLTPTRMAVVTLLQDFLVVFALPFYSQFLVAVSLPFYGPFLVAILMHGPLYLYFTCVFSWRWQCLSYLSYLLREFLV